MFQASSRSTAPSPTMASYRADELRWFREHVESTPRVSEAPFRIVLMHQPGWGWSTEGPEPWIETANRAGVDLVIAGHRHRFSHAPPGPDIPHSYHLVVVGQGQVARVNATTQTLQVVVAGLDGSVAHTVEIPRQQ